MMDLREPCQKCTAIGLSTRHPEPQLLQEPASEGAAAVFPLGLGIEGVEVLRSSIQQCGEVWPLLDLEVAILVQEPNNTAARKSSRAS